MISRILAAGALALMLAACGGADTSQAGLAEPAADADYERGPHNGRMLRDGDFALEVTIFETGVPPQFRLYAYDGGKPLAPRALQARIELHRPACQVDAFAFKPVEDYLVGDGTVIDPHSFAVAVAGPPAGDHTTSHTHS